ncbi:methyl-CpG-binding domain protein 4-like [Rhopalosiphum maidis]|uniref:methyl-CpG-binding domain protein 4-like n=1 Tax=Rhopalosiphum maidis TaxID=43146 RepID=UPI000F00E659|nr:methyl-CpG-binding domain protein 4-like [Rhopalosiphum maidis]XP_026813334.1 methyl-CpG-binding domain protein 4-like [Rhopalosiphum maidis]XP_026813335.1 methyl-CpG-binding domain protein 4-like [Rhopalosiphum maidis]XP_026813336.1 methyl-CpG-binding domain protein 4-like [Rhopalosiphum maidis]XP_026813337.1 methyl-CpG-binding domain protein 4-like [Rhopalosiphum maidis]
METDHGKLKCIDKNSKMKCPTPHTEKIVNARKITYCRRPGLIYKNLIKNQNAIQTSQYFELTCGVHQWIPPRSPYALIQEDLFHNPWQLLIATIFLTKVTAKLAIPKIHEFLLKWPTPEDVTKANPQDLLFSVKNLGLENTRVKTIKRFTADFLSKNWKYPIELYGIGKYGNDSYRLFCVNEWRIVQPDDILLSKYKDWLTLNEKQLGI